ncbi:matrix metalloproteinase-15-like isoform X2 [Xenia sp. Carnegie-2017]|uniref:matrix metalloproteinase-15-like isoform X2 n=1 Tax=Xenia sp. Carnegie-2017 TaxID=2897299 RepID=UPI001F049401|nr:matrix metalloproteinase-15-like isoform X2 [Xenia sp. Carnegie-2017]
MKVYTTCIIAVIGWTICKASPQKKKRKDPFLYLQRYGYIESMAGQISHAHSADNAIRKFQRYAKLPVTGIMDRATRKKLTGPRCGSQDFTPRGSNSGNVVGMAARAIQVSSFRDMRRKKRYVKQGSSWKKRTITWSLQNYPSSSIRMSKRDVERTLVRAFNMWQSASQLNFRRLANKNLNVDIIVKFGKRYHGDPYLFDGEGGTLAHAFYPGITNTGLSGDIHFDDDEIWSLNGQQGTTDFMWTSLHEIGHAIGLEHSERRDAIMWPWFEGYRANVKLKQDDINGIQSIYGTRVQATSCSTNGKFKPVVSSVCYNSRLDAVVYHKESCTTYLFLGAYLWRMDDAKRAGQRERISSVFRGLAGNIDAAYARSDGSLVFFRYNQFWIYNKNFRKLQGPLDIQRFIKNARNVRLRRIGAAMVWDGNNRVYFFRGKKYWRYNEKNKVIDKGYPKRTSVWRDVRSPVDAAFSWKNSKTFFLRGNDIDKFSNSLFRVRKGRKINKFVRNC